VVAGDWVDHQKCTGMYQDLRLGRKGVPQMAAVSQIFKIHGATACDNLLANELAFGTLFPRVGDWIGLLRANMEGITDGEGDRPQALDG